MPRATKQSSAVSRLKRLASGKYSVQQNVCIGTNVIVHLTWESNGKTEFAFHVYFEGDISEAVKCLKTAKSNWNCKVVLVVKSTQAGINAEWCADSYSVSDFRAIPYNLLTRKRLRKSPLIKKWLGL